MDIHICTANPRFGLQRFRFMPVSVHAGSVCGPVSVQPGSVRQPVSVQPGSVREPVSVQSGS